MCRRAVIDASRHAVSTTDGAARNRSAGEPPRRPIGAFRRWRSLLAQPGLPLRLVLLDPLLGRFLGGHVLVRDVVRDDVLVVVGPGEVLDEVVGCAALGRELRADDLVERGLGIVAGDLLEVARVAALRERRQVDPDELDLRIQATADLPIGDERTSCWCRPSEGVIVAASLPEKTTLKFRSRFVTRASSYWTNEGSLPRNWPLSPDSDVLNRSAYLLRLFQSVMSGCFVDHPRGNVPADDPVVAGLAGVLGDLVLVDSTSSRAPGGPSSR